MSELKDIDPCALGRRWFRRPRAPTL